MECVTVLLTTYNQQNYIYQAIDSVLMQDYENIQLIVTDDGSAYFSVEEIEGYIKEKNNGNIMGCVVLKNKTNLGTVRNLNLARKHVLGKYMMPLSGDDLFFDEKVLSNYVQAFHKHKEAEVIVSQVLHYDEKMEYVMFQCLNEEQKALLKEGNNRKLYGKLCTDCFIPAIGSAYSTEMLMRMGEYDERYYLVEDWPYYLKILRNDVKFCYSDFVSAKHRDGGVSHSKKKKSEERKDRYHQDLIAIIENEILVNYKFAEENMQKSIYQYANDRIVISQFRSEFGKMSLRDKMKWIWKNKNLLAILIRGCMRRYRFRKNIVA